MTVEMRSTKLYLYSVLETSLIIVCILSLFLIGEVDGAPRSTLKRGKNAVSREKGYQAGVFVGFLLVSILGLYGCCFCCRQFCPNGPEFTALDLDEIRIEQMTEIEQGIRKNIRDLKEKLSFHRKKKETLKRDRDVKLFIQKHVLGRDEETGSLLGRERDDNIANVFAEPNNFDSPMRTKKNTNNRNSDEIQSDLRALLDKGKASKSLIEDEPPSKEDDDMWRLWNKMKDKDKADVKQSVPEQTEAANDSKYAYKAIKYTNKSKQIASSGAAGAVEMTKPAPPAASMEVKRSPLYNNNGFSDEKKDFDALEDRYVRSLSTKKKDEDEKKGKGYYIPKIARPAPPSSIALQSPLASANLPLKPLAQDFAEPRPAPSQNGGGNYSINVNVQDYRNAEKYDLNVASNPLLASQRAGSSMPIPAAATTSNVTPAAPVPGGGLMGGDRVLARRPPPPRGPPPKHLNGVSEKLKKFASNTPNSQRFDGGGDDDSRDKED